MRAGLIGKVPIAPGPLDRYARLASLAGGAVYLVCACLSLLLARAGDTVTPVWLPNALAVVLLLRARLSHEWLFLALAFLASLAANQVAQLPWTVALVFSFANAVEIAVVVALARQAGAGGCDMTRLSHLARFVWAGGPVGPLVSGLIAATVMGAIWPLCATASSPGS